MRRASGEESLHAISKIETPERRRENAWPTEHNESSLNTLFENLPRSRRAWGYSRSEEVRNEYNQSISILKVDEAVVEEEKTSCYTFALMQHSNIAHSQMIERTRMKDVLSQVEEQLKKWCSSLGVRLKDSRGYTFQEVVPVDQGETQDTEVADASATKTRQSDRQYVADIGLATADASRLG